MKKRVAIPLSILFGLVFWFIVLGIIGSKMEPPQRQQLAEQPETISQSAQEPEAPQPVMIESQQTVTPEPDLQITQAKSDNILLRANLIEAPVLNGSNQRIGTRAYITIPQDVLLEFVTLDDVTEFYWSFQGKGYNWVSIMCPEGTGLIFPGGRGIATYGELDRQGRMTEKTHWSIIYDEKTKVFKELEN
jgi:hypothetical protein